LLKSWCAVIVNLTHLVTRRGFGGISSRSAA
jgi:hypothetical protein